MARFTLAVIVCGVAVRLYELAYGTRLIGSILWLLVFIGLMIAGVYYLVRLITYVRQRMLWRLSGRLAVTYVFIAFVPIVLILVLVVIGAMIINGQFAAFLVSQRLDNHFDELKQLNRVVAREAIHTAARKPAQLIGELHAFYVDDLGHYASSYPGLQITLRVGVEAEAFTLTGQRLDDVITMPPWLTQEEWAGVTTDEGKIALRAVDHVGTPAGNLALILSMPITPELLNQVGEGIGPVEVYEGRGGNPAQPNSNPNPNPSLNAIHSSSLARPEAHSWLDFPVFGVSEINPVDWRSNDFHRRNTSVVMAVYSRVYALNGQLFRTLGRHSSVPVDIFIAVCIVFLIIEIVALAFGIGLTRSITSTVNKLQIATERVKKGDFSHRIDLPARDQVSALGGAFDTMTASVERLMIESQEKLRLESEVKIAREVQALLFPQHTPELPGVNMFGVCHPARGVSGDYYDFLKLSNEHAGLVLGDVSGKGIFAALLMATIQSAIHSQFYDGRAARNARDGVAVSPAEVVERLNRQLYENTPEGKYATFFYGIYQAESRRLTYTNAGHPAPFLFRRERLERLDRGGTIIGMFPHVKFEQAEVQLEPGDLLLAFTDGMTEPENSYGEEFGEERLLEILRESINAPPEVLTEQIYQTLTDWTGSSELQDDMTMIYLKCLH
ncbi:MAG TPA: SpoIIE family protein phosphatase [Terriglobia bacterium]|nr:SpoIIE family protein phosphatase [Terriglobia bacterium]